MSVQAVNVTLKLGRHGLLWVQREHLAELRLKQLLHRRDIVFRRTAFAVRRAVDSRAPAVGLHLWVRELHRGVALLWAAERV